MKSLKNYFFITLTLVISLSSVVVKASAEEIAITGNGSDSSNEISITQSQDTNASQNNDASVNNDISISTNTGDNSASDNTNGDTAIKTGNTEVKTNISNNVNNSVASTTCCPTITHSYGSQAVISGNGAGSNNNFSANNTNTATVAVNNNASITNNISGYANTGSNTANDNSGDVLITTGNISVQEKIKNTGNTSYVNLGLPLEKEYMVKIFGNGAYSNNEVDFINDNTIEVIVNNTADITNSNDWILNTGDNKANDNNGEVTIKTGDITFEKEIVNDVNKSAVDTTCCEKEEEKEKPQPVTPAEKPVSPSNPGGHGGNPSNPSKDEVQSAMVEVLPVTGNLWFFLALAANIALLIFGTYMRLRSGRSPGLAIA